MRSAVSYMPESCAVPVCRNNATLCPDSEICEPIPMRAFDIIDLSCTAVFIVDLAIRLALCPFVPTRYPGVWASVSCGCLYCLPL